MSMHDEWLKSQGYGCKECGASYGHYPKCSTLRTVNHGQVKFERGSKKPVIVPIDTVEFLRDKLCGKPEPEPESEFRAESFVPSEGDHIILSGLGVRWMNLKPTHSCQLRTGDSCA